MLCDHMLMCIFMEVLMKMKLMDPGMVVPAKCTTEVNV